MLNATIIVRPLLNTDTQKVVGNRVAFLYPNKREFLMAAMAMKARKLLRFGESPIKGAVDYKAFYADINDASPKTYAKYAMLVRDFYASNIQEKFNAIFPGLDHKSIKVAIHNPNTVMEAQREVVERLIEKYKDTTSPLEFYGSKHIAEGVALMMGVLRSAEFKGFIDADEQGLGKSRTSIVAAIESGKKRILVIAPKTARMTTWPTEIKLVDPKATIFLANHHDYESNAAWTLLQWDLLRQMPKHFFETYAQTFDLIIADEFHMSKHATSARSKALAEISKKVPHLFGLTGTPVTKRPRDILNLLKLIGHPIAKDEWGFLKRYCLDPGETADDADFKGAKNIDELHMVLRDCLIRREKNQTNLPPKVRYVKKVPLNDEDRRRYDQVWPKYYQEHREKIESTENYPIKMVKFGKEKEMVSSLKVPHVIEWAEELLDAGEKVAIFTEFTEIYNLYRQHFGSLAVGIDGRSSDKQRAAAVDGFQHDEKIRVFVGNTIAAGLSITLTAGHYMAINDLTWLPTDQLQVEDRQNRGGQTETASVYYFLAKDTMDEEVFEDFIKHKAVVQTIVNRRNEEGNIHDAEWRGDTAGTSVETRASIIKEGFDWSDVGEEPITDQLPASIQRLIQVKGLGNPGLINQLTLYMKLRKLEMGHQWHSQGDQNFGYSLIQWFEQRVFFSPNQENTAEKMLGRYFKELAGFQPQGLPSLPPKDTTPKEEAAVPQDKPVASATRAEEQKAIAQQAESLLEVGRLSKWDHDFLESVLEGFEKWGRFTEKQQAAVQKILTRYGR